MNSEISHGFFKKIKKYQKRACRRIKTSAVGPFHAYERKIDGKMTINPENRQQQSRPLSLFIHNFFKSKAKARKNNSDRTFAFPKETARMLKTIGQLTLERDFLQDCFRRTGRPIPEFDPNKF